tara:strand:- start:12216 stop:15437 length:3222 start_codon:yes stop_codon:yes gene_type:complete
MKKIRLSEEQIIMLQKVSDNKVLKINEDQYSRLFKGGFNSSKAVGKNIKKHLGENSKPIDVSNFAQEVIVFVKDVITNPKTTPLSSFWEDLGISKRKLFNMVKDAGLLELSIDETNNSRSYTSGKFGFRKKVKELYKTINEFGDAGYPAGAEHDPNASWNEPDYEEEEGEGPIQAEKEILEQVYFGDESDDLMIFQKGDNKYVIVADNMDGELLDPYESIPYAGSEEAIYNYVNDKLYRKEIAVQQGVKALYDGQLVIITPDIKEALLKHFGDDVKLVEILNQIPETTVAVSSGPFVPGGSFNGPSKSYDRSQSPEEAMTDTLSEDLARNSYKVTYNRDDNGGDTSPFLDDFWEVQEFMANLVKQNIINNIEVSKTDEEGKVIKSFVYDWNDVEWLKREAIQEMDSADAGGDSDTFAFDAPAGDGSSFWNAGNKQNKGNAGAVKPKGMPIIKGGLAEDTEGHENPDYNPLFTEDEQIFPQDDKFRSGFDLDKKDELFQNYANIKNMGAKSPQEYETNLKPRLESQVLKAKAIKAKENGEDATMFEEDENDRQDYLRLLQQWKLRNNNDRASNAKTLKFLKAAAKKIGINFLGEGKTIKITQEQLNKIVESENMTQTAYPNGEMIDFDDCVKFNNNTKAQDGGCSQGAVDNVVKTKKTKGSVVSEGLKLMHDKGNQMLAVISDNKDPKAASKETYTSKNILKKNGFKWNGSNWSIPIDQLEIAKKTLSEVNKVEYFVDKLEELGELVQGAGDAVGGKDLINAQLDQYITDIANATDEAAASAEIRRYLNFHSNFHQYSFNNRILIYIQRPTASKVASFNAWKKKGRKVQKGSKGIKVLVPIFRKGENPGVGSKKPEIDLTDLDSLAKGSMGAQPVGFKVGNVFDIADTKAFNEEGETPDSVQWAGTNEPSEIADKLFNSLSMVADNLGVKVTSADSRRGEKGFSAGDHINLTSDVKGAGRASTMAHEMAHELMHWKKKSMYYIGDENIRNKALLELQAETVSYVVLKHYGIPVQHHAKYLALWGANKEKILKYLKLISDVADFIIREVDKVAKYETDDAKVSESIGAILKEIGF